MPRQNDDTEYEYPPGIQDVIDRFIRGDIPLRQKPPTDDLLGLNEKQKSAIRQWEYHDDYESAKRSVDYKAEQRKWGV